MKEVVKDKEVLTETPVGKVDDITEEVDEVTPEEVTPEAPETPKAGDKTEPNKLLKSLKEEREKRRLLEEELEQLKSSVLPDDIDEELEDSGELKKTLSETTARISKLEREQVFSKVLADNPILIGKEAEFEAYLDEDENRNISISRAAKLFIAENGLNEPQRKGLEKSTGGDRTPQTSGMTSEEVAELRNTNFNKYRELAKAGKIQIK